MPRPRAAAARPLVGLLLAGALALPACSGDPDRGATATSVGGADVASTLPRSLTGATDLRRLVVSNPPIGYDLLASPPFGPVTLQRLLDDFSDSPAEDEVILRDARFKAGYTRGWLRDEPRAFLGIFVFEFSGEAGARFARDRFAAQNEAKKDAARFDVPGIVDAEGKSYTQEVEGQPPERIHVITFVRGARLYQVAGQSADQQAPADETVAFARIEDQIAA
ncbi:MAG: hypothetical protein QOI56_2106 [Actinomycetota bacterium]|jgi:hypothetical protein|nr:hypothetical protein [Actinomycetota bacterium]